MGQGINRVFVDANVLYGRTQRDWFGLLTTDSISAPFRVYWSEDVLAEAIHHLRDRHPHWQGSKISGICERVRAMWADGYVADFVIDGSYPGNDPKDAHVHAAALACSAQYLVTNNLSDFPTEESDTLPYEVYRPDDFSLFLSTRSRLPWWRPASPVRLSTGPSAKTMWRSSRPSRGPTAHSSLTGLSDTCGSERFVGDEALHRPWSDRPTPGAR